MFSSIPYSQAFRVLKHSASSKVCIAYGESTQHGRPGTFIYANITLIDDANNRQTTRLTSLESAVDAVATYVAHELR